MEQIEDNVTTCPHCGFNEITLRQESYYLDPGTIVGGKYIVGRVLSYGGHTISYLGMDAESNQKVVVKEYLPSDFSTRSEGEKEITIFSGDAQEQFEQGLTNFLNEANRIQHLSDVEGIAKIYDCVAENDTGYVISEYVEGKTLKEILDEGKKYSVEETVEFISRILSGLSQVHPLDIVHCDIAPETIMVTNSGDIKLLDFGATRYVTTANSKSLAIILKQGYAPEEQYRSRGVRGPWTDIYALAAVMYRMITGVVPQESVERALVDELKEPSKMGIKIPENVENAMMNALNVYQQERTQSADVFLKELHSPSVKRIKTKRKRNETGKFPVWAKGLVAGLLCIVVVGGVVLYKMSGNDVENIASTEAKMPELVNCTIDEANEKLKSQQNFADVKLEAQPDEYIYDKSKNGIISSQSIPAGADLTDEDLLKQEGLSIDDEGKISGTIHYSQYRSDKIYYSELADKNVYEFASDIDDSGMNNSKISFVEKEDDSKSYYDIASIEMQDGTIVKPADIRASDADKNEITVADIKTIQYYVAAFFYRKSFKASEFVGHYVTEKFPSSKMDGAKRKSAGKKSLAGTNWVDSEYYSFKEKSGYIFAYNKVDGVKEGELLDTSKITDKIFMAVGKQFETSGKTGEQLKSEIKKELGDDTDITISGGGSDQKVTDVKVTNTTLNQTTTHFKKDDKVKIEITTAKPEPTAAPAQDTPEPKTQQSTPTQKPKQNTKPKGNSNSQDNQVF
jgi:serine/threonine protein kinase